MANRVSIIKYLPGKTDGGFLAKPYLQKKKVSSILPENEAIGASWRWKGDVPTGALALVLNMREMVVRITTG